jgi:hypothetical protein
MQIMHNRLELHMPNSELLAHSERKQSPRERFVSKSTARMQQKPTGFHQQPRRYFGHPVTQVNLFVVCLPCCPIMAGGWRCTPQNYQRAPCPHPHWRSGLICATEIAGFVPV